MVEKWISGASGSFHSNTSISLVENIYHLFFSDSCVLGEMFSRKPILPGTSDLDQLEKIFNLCGSPNQHNWPNYDELPGCEGVKRFQNTSRRVKAAYESLVSSISFISTRLISLCVITVLEKRRATYWIGC